MSEDKVVYRFIRVAHRGKSGWCGFPPGREKKLRFVNGSCTYVATAEEAKAIDEWIEKCELPYGNQYVLDEFRNPILKVPKTVDKLSADAAFKKPAQEQLSEDWVGFHDAVKFNGGYEKGLGPKAFNAAVREGRIRRAERDGSAYYHTGDIAKELSLKHEGKKE